eukprot:symbB.v1.2.035609.t1/scaffold4839.1/size34051/2
MVILPKHALLVLLLSAVTSEDAPSEDQQSLIALPRRKEGVIRNSTLDVPLEPEVLPRKSALGFLLADGVDALDLRQDVSSSKGPETTVTWRFRVLVKGRFVSFMAGRSEKYC